MGKTRAVNSEYGASPIYAEVWAPFNEDIEGTGRDRQRRRKTKRARKVGFSVGLP